MLVPRGRAILTPISAACHLHSYKAVAKWLIASPHRTCRVLCTASSARVTGAECLITDTEAFPLRHLQRSYECGAAHGHRKTWGQKGLVRGVTRVMDAKRAPVPAQFHQSGTQKGLQVSTTAPGFDMHFKKGFGFPGGEVYSRRRSSSPHATDPIRLVRRRSCTITAPSPRGSIQR